MPEFGPRQPIDKEKNTNDEDKISRRDFLKKAGGLVFGALAGASIIETAGCAREDKRANEEEKRMRKSGEDLENRIRKEELEKTIKEDPRSEYDSLDDYLEDYPHLKENGYEIELEAAEEYFKNREKK